MDHPGRLITCIIAVILLTLFSLSYIAQSGDENIDCTIDDCTQKLSESIRNKGYLDKSMYEEYVKSLDASGELYDVEIEDIRPVTGDLTNEEANNNPYKIDTANMSFQKKSIKNILGDIPKQSSTKRSNPNRLEFLSSLNLTGKKDINNYGLNLMDKNEDRIFSFSTHTHTDACYAGHRHIDSCYSYVGNRDVPLNIRVTRLSDAHYWDKYYKMFQIEIKCAKCGNTIAYFGVSDCYWYEHGDPNTFDSVGFYETFYSYNKYVGGIGKYVVPDYDAITYTRAYSPNTNFDTLLNSLYNLRDYLSNIKGLYYDDSRGEYIGSGIIISADNFPSVPYLTYDNQFPASWVYQGCANCGGPTKQAVCGFTQDETPICDRVVTSLSAAYPTQVINQGEDINAAGTAVMLDGSVKTVSCSVSGFDKNRIGSQTATLTYYGLIGNAKTPSSISCYVNVTVKNPRTLVSISVSPSSQIIKRFGTPSFTVTAYYSDGSGTALTPSQYTMTSFDNSVPGEHPINFTYTENGISKMASTTVYVDVINSISVTPASQTVERYTPLSSLTFNVTVTRLYGGSYTIYSGYDISGYSPSEIGNQSVTVSYTEDGITKAVPVSVTVTVLHKTCPKCGNTYDLSTDDTDPGCPFCKQMITGIKVTPDSVKVEYGGSLPVIVNAIYNDGSSLPVSGWTSNYDANKTGLQTVTIEYGGLAAELSVWVNEEMIECPTCKQKYPVSEGRCPVCSAKVVSISASPDNITVYQGDNINLTVTAYYADGHSDIVTDWSIDKDTSKPGTFHSTVSYKGITTTITLTVISKTAVVCPICGRIYEPADNPQGCPVCSKQLTGIEAYLTNGGNLVQYGSNPSLDIILIYKDTHREITTDGYTLENYNAYKLGAQTITVHYQEFAATLDIEVVNTLSDTITCPNGHIYYRDEDGTDPGCPYCNTDTGSSTVCYYDITYTNEILDTVYKGGSYHFQSGNYITVRVIKKDRSVLVKMQRWFFKTAMIGRKKEFIYGGEVL